MSDCREFAGRTGIVTGASRGIGNATARMLAERGASLVLVGRDEDRLRTLTDDLNRDRKTAVFVTGDIAAPETASRAVAAALHEFDGLDILANVAGAFPTARLEETTDALFAETMAANFTGTFMMCRAAAPVLRSTGSGAIVNISSTAARLGTPGLPVYSASKAGIEAFGRSIAIELAPDVRVNTVSVGPTHTETVDALLRSDTTGAVEAVTSSLPLKRLGHPEEIAEMILFLASPKAGFITGQVFHVNGGGVMP